jgi:ATP-binding cassette, subfamily C, bacterial
VLHPHLGWVTLGAAILIVFISFANQFMTRVPLQETARQMMIALERAQAQVRNAEVVRSMGMTEACLGSWGEANAKGLIAADRAGRVNALLSGATKTLRLLLQIAILGYGAFLVLADHTVSAGIIFAASIISARALAPLDQVVGGWRTYVASMQSWRRVRDHLAASPARPEPMALPAPSPTLSVEKLVYLARSGSEPIIKGMSFSIEPGDVVGIIGPSGAGKSTLARLLVGALRPTAGIVRIGGDDIQHWSADTLGPYLGYVPQDVELMPATVAQNIARMDSSPDVNGGAKLGHWAAQ